MSNPLPNYRVSMDYRCPTCGAWAVEETLVRRLDGHLVETQFGTALVWFEVHLCLCGCEYRVVNSDL